MTSTLAPAFTPPPFPTKRRRNEVLFLDPQGQPFAAITARGKLWRASRTPEGKIWFSYPGTDTERAFGIDALNYSGKRDFEKALGAHFFPNPENLL